MTVTDSELFRRNCRVLVDSAANLNGSSATINHLEIEGLRVKFNLKKTWHWTPNIGQVEIYNLDKDSRAKVNLKYVVVRVYAGYGDKLALVGALAARQVNSKHVGPDWITTFQGGDGAHRLEHARLSINAGPKIPYLDVATKLIDKAAGKVVKGFSLTKLQQATAGKVFKRGFAFRGKAGPGLARFLDTIGLEFSIQDGEIQIVDRGPLSTNGQIFEVSSESGLVGSPEYASPPNPGKPRELKWRMLLQPSVQVKTKIKLNSKSHVGEYVARTVSQIGDTFGKEWYTEVSALALPGAT